MMAHGPHRTSLDQQHMTRILHLAHSLDTTRAALDLELAGMVLLLFVVVLGSQLIAHLH